MDVQSKELGYIKLRIEEKRKELNELVEVRSYNMLDPKVIEVSQELDKLLTKYIKKDRNVLLILGK